MAKFFVIRNQGYDGDEWDEFDTWPEVEEFLKNLNPEHGDHTAGHITIIEGQEIELEWETDKRTGWIDGRTVRRKDPKT